LLKIAKNFDHNIDPWQQKFKQNYLTAAIAVAKVRWYIFIPTIPIWVH
jgi:hypothetical protein